jgi:hypothetical protein
VLAEKIVTMVDRGDATTRARDFANVFVLTKRYGVGAADRWCGAGHRSHRQSDLRPFRSVIITLTSSKQADWERFVTRSGLDAEVPPD